MEIIKDIVYIVVESDLRWRFFQRFIKSFNQMGYEVDIITICPSLYLNKKLFNGKIHLLSKCKKEYINIFPSKEILDVESRLLSKDTAKNIIGSWLNELDEISKNTKPKACFIYNGTTILTYTSKLWCKRNEIPTCFFELANIEGKMFIDPMGTNAKSYLFKNIDILKGFNVTDGKYKIWLESYKKRKNEVKQAKFSGQFKTVCKFALNQIFFLHYIGSLQEKVNFMKQWFMRFLNRYKRNETLVDIDAYEMKPYYLFPMQVSMDSQVLLNSSVNIQEALILAKRKASMDGVNLVIKPHPAEQDKNVIRELKKMESNHIRIVNGDINRLISNAEKIITINSTVGLESILYGKKVEFLGESFYERLAKNREYLKSYICGYLVNIDYFSNRDISVKVVNECLRRADVW